METDAAEEALRAFGVALAGSNIWLLVGIKGAIWSQTKRINALSELLKRGEVGGSKKVR